LRANNSSYSLKSVRGEEDGAYSSILEEKTVASYLPARKGKKGAWEKNMEQNQKKKGKGKGASVAVCQEKRCTTTLP